MSVIPVLRAAFIQFKARGCDINDTLDDNGWALVRMPYTDAPVRLHDNELTIQIRLASSGRFFTLFSPLALLHETPNAPALEHLLRRQFYADQVGAASVAIAQVGDADVLQAVAHWMLPTLTAEEFSKLFEIFVQAVFTLIPEVVQLAEAGQPLQPLHHLR